MQCIQFDRWTLEVDPYATKTAHAVMAVERAATQCNCTGCQNFVQARDLGLVFPEVALALFRELGVDPGVEAEIYHTARLDSGLHLYGGFYHFVGCLVAGSDAMVPVSSSAWHHDLKPVTERFSLGFTALADLVPLPLRGYPLVQIEIEAMVPWVIEEEEPQ